MSITTSGWGGGAISSAGWGGGLSIPIRCLDAYKLLEILGQPETILDGGTDLTLTLEINQEIWLRLEAEGTAAVTLAFDPDASAIIAQDEDPEAGVTLVLGTEPAVATLEICHDGICLVTLPLESGQLIEIGTDASVTLDVGADATAILDSGPIWDDQ